MSICTMQFKLVTLKHLELLWRSGRFLINGVDKLGTVSHCVVYVAHVFSEPEGFVNLKVFLFIYLFY